MDRGRYAKKRDHYFLPLGKKKNVTLIEKKKKRVTVITS